MLTADSACEIRIEGVLDRNTGAPNIKADDRNEDWLLYVKFKEGDPSAFHELFKRHKTRVINLAYRFVRNQEVAEDIAQDVFVKVYEKRVVVDLKAKLSTWFYRVTVNASMDYLKSKDSHFISLDERLDNKSQNKTRLETTADTESLSPLQILGTSELQDLIRKEVDALPKNLKFCLLLYQFEEMSYQEISKILGITEKAVERRLYHAKETLRKSLSREYALSKNS